MFIIRAALIALLALSLVACEDKPGTNEPIANDPQPEKNAKPITHEDLKLIEVGEDVEDVGRRLPRPLTRESASERAETYRAKNPDGTGIVIEVDPTSGKVRRIQNDGIEAD